jgi:hypothetical protein
MLMFTQQSGTDTVGLYRITNGGLTVFASAARELAAGTRLFVRANGSALEGWEQEGSTWTRVVQTTESTYSTGVYAGIGIRGTSGRIDDFGARNLGPAPPPGAPSAPTNLQAQAGNTTVSLTWTAPSSNGGSPLSAYKIYRSENGAAKSLLTTVGTAPTSFQDSGLNTGTLYAYEVSAVNEATLEGLPSNEASATPVSDTPLEPLLHLDSFNRANESPLASAAGWSNGTGGSSETGLYISSNVVGCSKSTTCTAWRTTPTYGPDSEAWVTVTTTPGNGNVVRVKLRLQSPGSGGVDGYMLMYTQQSGTDTVALYRITNGSLTALASAGREIAAGTRLFVRARGNALEAWVQEGSAWTRVVQTTDSTYPNAGYTGIGIRGKTGRIDDFGAR